jgi:hypothetical protein
VKKKKITAAAAEAEAQLVNTVGGHIYIIATIMF